LIRRPVLAVAGQGKQDASSDARRRSAATAAPSRHRGTVRSGTARSRADDTSRGRVVGTVTTGLLMGILLARTVAGLVAGYSSWRVMYVTAAVLALALAATLARTLPPETAQAPLSYGQPLRSTAGMWRSESGRLRLRWRYRPGRARGVGL
jgi:MFS family permease